MAKYAMRQWMNLFEGAQPLLTFNHREGCWVFNGFGVHSELLGSPEQTLGVMTFSSLEPGLGNGEKALRWLKTQCQSLHVYDPGEPGDDSFEFWKRMCDKGIIDSMEDEDNNLIYADGEWVQGEPEDDDA